MKARWMFRGVFILSVLAALCCVTGGAWASQKLLKGEVWVRMSADEKAAYLWGAGDVVDVEQELAAIYPELKQEDFSHKAVEGIGDVPMNNIVETIDGWYEANPDKLHISVLRVIWDTMIKPNIKTGIAGKPLQ